MNARLSIVIGTLNRLEQLRRCIDSVNAQTSTPNVIYVADAGSTDGTIEYLNAIASEKIRPVLAGVRKGQARAYNEIFADVQTPYVAWLSDDNEVVNAGLDVAVSCLQRNARIGMVGLKVKDRRGPFVDHPYLGALTKSLAILNINQGVVRTPLMQSVGGFSELFSDYGIDADITTKILFSGWDVVMTKVIAIHHYRNWPELESSAHQKLQNRLEVVAYLYREKYKDRIRSSRFLKRKRAFYDWLVARSPDRFGSKSGRKTLGLMGRDVFNVLNAQYIGVLDPVRTMFAAYHLVQHCPARKLPTELPPDPSPVDAVPEWYKRKKKAKA
jgi:GT2 family glycosyltransferase